MKTILLIVAVAAMNGCTNANASHEALDDLGFKNIQTGGYSFFACGRDYTYHTEFTATNPNGKRVSGVVCCGILKSCSVKF